MVRPGIDLDSIPFIRTKSWICLDVFSAALRHSNVGESTGDCPQRSVTPASAGSRYFAVSATRGRGRMTFSKTYAMKLTRLVDICRLRSHEWHENAATKMSTGPVRPQRCSPSASKAMLAFRCSITYSVPLGGSSLIRSTAKSKLTVSAENRPVSRTKA